MSKPPSSNTLASKIPYSDLPTTVQRLFQEEPEIVEALNYLHKFDGTVYELLEQRWNQYSDKLRFLGHCLTILAADQARVEDAKTVLSGEGFDQDHIRDPDNICRAYVKGPRLREAACEGDNHYLCQGCREYCGGLRQDPAQ